MSSRIWSNLAGVAALLLGVLATLMVVVFLLACAPNSSPEQWVSIRRLMIAAGVVGGVSAVGAIGLLLAARPWAATIVALVPVGIVIVLCVVATVCSAMS